jgi:hypothetical protein
VDRKIVVAAMARGTAGSAVASVTVAGVSASLLVARTNSTSGNNVAELWIASVPTGTTGDIVVTYNGEMLRMRYSAFRLVGARPAVHDTDSGAATDPSASLDVPAAGAAIGCAIGTSSGSEVWSGLTEDSSADVEAQARATAAHDDFATIQAPLAVSVNFTTTTNAALAVASWGPSGDGNDMPWPALNQPLSRPPQVAVPYH